ncbi:MAG: aldehyde dehydrogenase family protein, partial [Micrococcaceae bacterium]|nr:aldehyde dehydrogenase family protein [Micrococcaceae bacterium]
MSTETNTVATYADAEELLAAVQAQTGGREILDPATGDLVGRAPEHGVADLEKAIAAARGAQRPWDAKGHDARRALLNKAADAIEANAEALA